NMVRRQPLLIYDGDCGFCIYWVRYWQRLTGDRVTYAPYQEVAKQYPEIPIAAFKRAVQYIGPDGKIASGAEAAFLVLSHARGKGFWLTLYRRLPGFAEIAEHLYALIASQRSASYRVSLWLWGRDYEPPRFDLVAWLFLRSMGVIYLSAFVSFGVQALGLIGSRGISPLSDFVDAIRSQLGSLGYWRFPMVFYLGQSDFAIQAVCWAGAALSLLLILDLLPRLSLFFLYVLYLSLFYAGQTFMGFQWDVLLLESGFLAVLLSLATRPGIWLLRWLLFRFMLLSGAVKLLSGDATWANLSALSYYFQTEPLPTPLAWYAHHLPQAILRASTLVTLVIELGLPFLIILPRRLRFVAAFGFLLLQVVILLTGNYAFFNLLTMALCLVLFDDAALRKVLPSSLTGFVQHHLRDIKPRKITSYAVGAFALPIVFAGLVQLQEVFMGRISAPGEWINDKIEPLHIVNTYGLFAVMTTARPEIIIEGSDDGVQWREYGFKYKPGDVMRRPRWNFPHQPRLDWQMWFAALGSAQENPWFMLFMQRLLENSPEVTALLGFNPFPHKAPLYVRALLYDYRYSSPQEKEATGAWWVRTPEGIYYPAISAGS
ncbi:lipase maturation factor family protein, partial [Candidatus Binatus sp.]|uniref:lipase maturation factor family protein n=1 Tax=Candidatus Binatus sp. TaxID=2811406 RepID=UPI003CC5DF4C